MSPQPESNVQEAIDDYLEAIGDTFGEAYRDAMTVEARGQHIMIRHPNARDGEIVPLFDMPTLSRYTREGWPHKPAD